MADQNEEENSDFDKWKRQRKHTIIAMLMVNFVGGIDMSIVLTTLVPYLQNTLHVENTNTYYAFITTAFCLSSALFGVVTGRLVDKTRRIKLFTRVTLLLQITGNLIYTIPYSPYYALFGRLIAGAGESFTAVCIGEVIRIYDNRGSNHVICWLASISSFGYVIGPIMSVPISMFRFHIWKILFDRYNTPGLVIALLAAATLVVCEFMVHDCSLVLDMKALMTKYSLTDEMDIEPYLPKEFLYGDSHEEDETEEDSDEKSNLLKKKPSKNSPTQRYNGNKNATGEKDNISHSFQEVMKTCDQWIIVVFSFLTMYLIASGESLIPLINFKVLKWDLTVLAGSIFGYGIILFIASVIMSKICTTPKSMFYIGYLSLPAIILSNTGLLMISMETVPRNKVQDGFSMFLFVFSLVFIWFFESIALRCLFGRMVPSHLQSFAEAFRNGVARFGMILSSFVTPFLMPHLMAYALVCIMVGALMFIVYVSRRKRLTEMGEDESATKIISS